MGHTFRGLEVMLAAECPALHEVGCAVWTAADERNSKEIAIDVTVLN